MIDYLLKMPKRFLIISLICSFFSIFWMLIYTTFFTVGDTLLSIHLSYNPFDYFDNIFKFLGLFLPSLLAFLAALAVAPNNEKDKAFKVFLFTLVFQIIFGVLCWFFIVKR